MDVNSLSTPINKTAALVSNQSGIEKHTEYLEVVNKIENLKLAIESRKKIMSDCECKDIKKMHGVKIQEIQRLITPLKAQLKILNMHRRESVSSLIIKECIKILSNDEWEKVVANANSKFRASEI